MSYINTTYNSVTRMTGLSGLDVDSLVYQLMQVERVKVDSVSKSRQILVWKQEQYREITSALQSFSNEYFNTLKSATDMRNSSIYNAFAVKYNGQDTNAYFTTSVGSGARAGSYTISKIVTAQTAKKNGSAAAGGITGSVLKESDIKGISSTAGNNEFAVEFNGEKKNIVIKDGLTDINDLVTDLQNKLNEAFGNGKITVSADSNKLTFSTSNTNTLTFSNTINGGYNSIFNSDLSSGITLTELNNKFRIKLGEVEKTLSLGAGTSYSKIDDVISDLQQLVDTEFGEGKITVKNENNKIVLESAVADTQVTASAVENGGLKSIGLDGANRANKISLDANIYSIKDNFATPLNVGGGENDISFVINGQTFSFDSRKTSINQIMAAVNSNTAAGVRMSYDSLYDRFVLESKQTGVTARVTASDSNGGFLTSLGLVANESGRDASITYYDGTKNADGTKNELTITRSTNSFTVNGITFNLQKDFEGEVDMTVSSDPTKAVELIKGFVNKYNELLDKINSKLSEKREYDYEPLTDTQKEAMKEDDIKKWEEKAKAGLLGNDSILQSIVTGLRNAVIESVEGSGLTLASIGIKSNSWTDRGKLYIDEEKLKNALSENPTEVIDLFTKQSDVLYNTAVTDSSARKERYEGSGLIYRIYDVIQDNIRTTTIGGHRGTLLEKAGMTGDRSLYTNTLYYQIADYDDKIDELNDELTQKENYYYLQFAQLETLINNMNTQSTWLAQQFA
jgi:flagellar hook-associated protein 2